MATSDELRALADQLEVMEELERAMLEAKAAAANAPDDADKQAAARDAIDEYAAKRMEYRQSPLAVVSSEAGSATIIPSGVHMTAGSQAPQPETEA